VNLVKSSLIGLGPNSKPVGFWVPDYCVVLIQMGASQTPGQSHQQAFPSVFAGWN